MRAENAERRPRPESGAQHTRSGASLRAGGTDDPLSAESLTPEQFVALSDERDAWIARLLADQRAEYQRGRRDGWRLGYRSGVDDECRAWLAGFAPARAAARIAGQGWAAIERRRWSLWGEPRTRAEYGRPHPRDNADREQLEHAA